MTIYSLDVLLSYLEPVCWSMSSSNCFFLTCIQVSQEAGQVVWHSHLFKMGLVKDRNGMDLTEAENIKKRWQEYTEELYKKELTTQMITMV